MNAIYIRRRKIFVLLGVVWVFMCLVLVALYRARESAKATTCWSELHSVTVALQLYINDYDETYPPKSASLRNILFRYLGGGDKLRCPSDAEGTVSYKLNPHLHGVSDNDIPNPERVVLLYEGEGEKINFRHLGESAIAFVDGNVKRIKEEDAKDLVWKVTPPPTIKKATKKSQSKTQERE